MLPKEIYSTQQVKELDRIAIEDHGIPAYELMQRAGQSCLDSLLESWPDIKSLQIYCGAGNNGGDGYVIARLAIEKGLQVELTSVGNENNLSTQASQAKQAKQDWLNACNTDDSQTNNRPQTLKPDLIIDALFGTGLSRPPKGEWLAAIQEINIENTPVFAVDIPSGLDSDTGMPLGEAVVADKTLSFIGMKQGLLTANAGNYTGKLEFNSLKLPSAVYAKITPVGERVTHELLVELLPTRKPSTHKGDCGHALIIGGAKGMQGAAQMASEACARSGAGLTTMATEQGQPPRPEIMSCNSNDTPALQNAIKRSSIIGIGPGLGSNDHAVSLLKNSIESNKRLVIDADALGLLALNPITNDQWILTPHPGEAARLLNTNTATIQCDRINSVRAIREKYGGVCILKGFGTLIYDGENLSICSDGNPGMATGGMGDVLTGVICGLLAQRLSNYDAARIGVYIHARAADIAAQARGQRGLMATDLLPFIQQLVNPNDHYKIQS